MAVAPRRATGQAGAAVRGGAWIALAGLLLTTIGAITRELDGTINVFQLTLARASLSLLVAVPVGVIRRGRAVFVTDCLRLHLLRGAISAVAVTAAFVSFTYLELATATTISFTAPFFVTLLGRIALDESVSNLRWACIALGFIGVSLAAQPGDAAGWAAGVAVIGALAVALAKLSVKKLAKQDSPETVLVYLFTTMTAISVLPAAWLGHSLTAGSVAAMAAIGVLSFLAQGCVVLGYRTAKASAVASAEYARLPFAVALGILFFDEGPSCRSIIGASLIVGAGAISSVFGDRNGRQ